MPRLFAEVVLPHLDAAFNYARWLTRDDVEAEEVVQDVTVFVWPESDTRVRANDVETIRGFNVRHWTANAMSFWAVTDAAPADLEAFKQAFGGR